MNDYMNEALTTATYASIGHRCIYPALGLGNEAGEVLGKIKKIFRDKNGEFSQESCHAIAEEIGDCLWYIAVLGNDIGYDLERIAQMNIDKLRDRKKRDKIHGDGDNR